MPGFAGDEAVGDNRSLRVWLEQNDLHFVLVVCSIQDVWTERMRQETAEQLAMNLNIPQDRQATFEPQLVAKYQRRLPGFDDHVIRMDARGMSVRQIQGHLQQLYALEVSPDLISTITDEVLAAAEQWQQRPLEAMYPIVYFAALRLKIRDEGTLKNKAEYLALGIRADGSKEVLGLWIAQTEGAKF